MTTLRVVVLLVAAAKATGDPLAGLGRVAGQTRIEASGALETLMLLADLTSSDPAPTEFQAQARARFALRANHPAVRETAALMARGFGYAELARFSTFLSQAPYLVLSDSEELNELADMLPRANAGFNLDRLHGYAKLVREFYWDAKLGQFLRGALPSYQRAVRRASPAGSASKVLVSLLAPAGRIEFERRTPRPVTYVVLGD
ncbi:MAG: hypothetical protein HY238_28190 [Acidobacteria bacterium]|nr:hypothetical protein [Acidobacteriota bacterium]